MEVPPAGFSAMFSSPKGLQQLAAMSQRVPWGVTALQQAHGVNMQHACTQNKVSLCTEPSLAAQKALRFVPEMLWPGRKRRPQQGRRFPLKDGTVCIK